jgi:hypothetical protein
MPFHCVWHIQCSSTCALSLFLACVACSLTCHNIYYHDIAYYIIAFYILSDFVYDPSRWAALATDPSQVPALGVTQCKPPRLGKRNGEVSKMCCMCRMSALTLQHELCMAIRTPACGAYRFPLGPVVSIQALRSHMAGHSPGHQALAGRNDNQTIYCRVHCEKCLKRNSY